MKNKILILLSVLLAVGMFTACSSTPGVANTTSLRTLSATGTGKIYITPDIAYIDIGIHTENVDISVALSDNNNQAQNIVNTLADLGVDLIDIQTTNFYVYPMSNYGTDGMVTSKYYSVDNSVNVTVRDLSKLGDLLDAVVGSGANTINGINFDVQDKAAATAQARDLAIQKAKDEAQAIAQSAGVTLGEIQNISIANSGSSAATAYDMGLGGSSSSVPISTGQLLISVDAYISYTLK